MWTSLFSLLLGSVQLNPQHPLQAERMNIPMPSKDLPSEPYQFWLKSEPNIFSPQDLISLPRPGLGVANPGKADLAIVPVSEYSFETNKTNKTLYIAPLESTISPIEFPIINGGEAFWLDSRTLAHVIGDNIYAVDLEYETTSPLVRLPRSPYLIGSFPSGSGASNFKFTGSKKVHTVSDVGNVQHVLVFSAKVYEDYNLTSVKERDDAWEKRKTSALVYEQLYVRHWDEYVGKKQPRLFSVELSFKKLGAKDEGKWVLGDEYFKLLEYTEHYTPVEPFGGTDDFDVSSTHVVYTTKDPSVPEATHTRQIIYIVPLKGGLEPRQISTGNHGATASPVFSPNGELVAWTEMAKDGAEADRAVVMVYDLKKNARWSITQDWDRSVGEIKFSEDGTTLYLTASEHAHVKIFSVSLASLSEKKPYFPTPSIIVGEHSSHGIQVLSNGKLLFTQSSFTSPNNVYVATLKSEGAKIASVSIEQITKFGAKELEGKELDAGESFWFDGVEKGRKVQGWSFKPPGHGERVRRGEGHDWPTIFLIHGGPQGAWEDSWSTRWNPNVFAQQGYWVIAVNPTGSTGFGQDFTDAISLEWGGKPFVDLKKGWEYALKHYPIDEHRTAAAGASWGGYAINWIQGHPDYGFGFKALFCHDGIFDMQNGGYTTDEVYFWEHEFGGKPWDKKARDLASKFNPAEFVHKWSTPQLIVHGGRDYRLAETEGLAAFNALQLRDVPSRLVLFPDENHWVLKPANSLKWHYEVFRWFDIYVSAQIMLDEAGEPLPCGDCGVSPKAGVPAVAQF